MTEELDFNTAGPQRSFEVIPAGTECELQLSIKAGGFGDGGWLTHSTTKKGESDHLNCEFVVISSPDGKYNKRKIWERLTVQGTNHADAIEISRKRIRAIIESARGIRKDDQSETAKAARRINGYGALEGLRFMARLGVEPAKDTFSARNNLAEIITPEQQSWRQVEQITAQSVASAPNASAQPAAAPPAGAIARPQWAE
jgi:hypothetical protein